MRKPRAPTPPPGMGGEQPARGRRPPHEVLLDAAPWMPPPYELHHVTAFKALSLGQANPDQQRQALDWLIRDACKTYDLSYRPGPDGDRETAMAEGRRHVGLQVVKMINLDVSKLRRSEPRGDQHEPQS